MEPNPYESPTTSEKQAPAGRFAHRCCPKCGARVPWRRFVGGTIFAKWPCDNCGELLRYCATRHIAMLAALLGVIFLLVALVYFADRALPGLFYFKYHDARLVELVLFLTAILALLVPAIGCIFIPGVSLASKPGLFRHRYCPACGGQIPLRRWIGTTNRKTGWPCEQCGVALRTSIQHQVMQCVVLAAVVLLFASLYLVLPRSISNWWVFVSLAVASGIFTVACAAPFLDGVVLASEPIPRLRLDICGLLVFETGWCLAVIIRGWFVHLGESPRTTSILLGVAAGMLLIAFVYSCSWLRALRKYPARYEEHRGSMPLQELDIVRVAKLNKNDRHYDGTNGVARPPAIGDVGTVVHLPNDPNAPVIVESVDENGHTTWLADFDRDELDLIERPPAK